MCPPMMAWNTTGACCWNTLAKPQPINGMMKKPIRPMVKVRSEAQPK